MENIKNIGGAIILLLLTWALICLFGYGWVSNLVSLLHMNFSGTITIEVVLRSIGIFVAPVGAILGFM
jgi:hypothetical protein